MLNRTPKLAVLCSKRAPGIEPLLPHLTCVITTHENASIPAGVPVIHHPIRAYDDRRTYDALSAYVLRELGVDTILCLGYIYVLTDVMLSAFPNRIFNIHDSDLTIKHPDGERKYTGLRSTRDAIVAGERETRSTLHLVTDKLDGGPILALSRPYPVAPFVHEAAAAGHTDIVKAYAYAQREWMMRDCWGKLALSVVGGWQLAVGGRTDLTVDPFDFPASPHTGFTANRQPPTANPS
jgi:folate-dependent phosphoribosylglycinamide formyltransferase PurN